MEIWAIPLATAVGGAVVVLLLREFVEWCKRPRFEIDFEERAGQKPYIPDYNNEAMQTAGDIHRIKYLRLMVHNKGKKPAMDCEAKLEISVEGGEINRPRLLDQYAGRRSRGVLRRLPSGPPGGKGGGIEPGRRPPAPRITGSCLCNGEEKEKALLDQDSPAHPGIGALRPLSRVEPTHSRERPLSPIRPYP